MGDLAGTRSTTAALPFFPLAVEDAVVSAATEEAAASPCRARHRKDRSRSRARGWSTACPPATPSPVLPLCLLLFDGARPEQDMAEAR
jgi:hypothetical protein